MFVETEARPAGEPAKVGTLKLSQAMRIGARLRPQCKGMHNDGKGCAIFAAFEGAGLDAIGHFERYGVWPYHLLEKYFGLPHQMKSEIWRRNDGGESREKIADWLESQGL